MSIATFDDTVDVPRPRPNELTRRVKAPSARQPDQDAPYVRVVGIFDLANSGERTCQHLDRPGSEPEGRRPTPAQSVVRPSPSTAFYPADPLFDGAKSAPQGWFW